MGFLDEYSKTGLFNGETRLTSQSRTSVSHVETEAGLNVWEAFQAVPTGDALPICFPLTQGVASPA